MPPLVRNPAAVSGPWSSSAVQPDHLGLDLTERREGLRVERVLVEVEQRRPGGDVVDRRATVVDQPERAARGPVDVVDTLGGEVGDHLVDGPTVLGSSIVGWWHDRRRRDVTLGHHAKITVVLPLTYVECRARFRRAATAAGARTDSHVVAAVGPAGETLSVDVAVTGSDEASRVLLVLSGVHGVEGFAGSAIQCELLEREPPPGVTVVNVHAVNPWGMAWWRRQNESNVDLNRNWARDRTTPAPNPGYDELHALLVPGGDELPSADGFLAAIRPALDEHGIDWVRDAVTRGQYVHPDGLYFGGVGVEASTAILEGIARSYVAGAEVALAVDLHTGHGRYGTYTLLSGAPEGSADDQWLRRRFDPDRIEVTAGRVGRERVGLLMAGLPDVLPGVEYHTATFELGTVGGTRMLLAERAEHWVHHHGNRADPVHAAAVWEHRVLDARRRRVGAHRPGPRPPRARPGADRPGRRCRPGFLGDLVALSATKCRQNPISGRRSTWTGGGGR